ncbi:MAG: sugar ABC transporter permease [Actinobacteria bacterium]|nr:sugar ABC transporter permease [Actinomycetota bacterium]
MGEDAERMATSTIERSKRKTKIQEALVGWGFVSIPMGLFFVLSIGIFFYAIYISTYNWGIMGPRGFLGIENYTKAIHDPIFLKAIRNSILYAALVVPLQTMAGLILALLVNSKIKGSRFFRSSFYFPSVASSAAITTLFIFLMAPEGLFNKILTFFGVDVPNLFNQGAWLSDSRTALFSVIGLNAWTTSGTMMLFYLANLQSIDGSYTEAAIMDGASRRQVFWYITMPLLKPAHFFVVTSGMIGALQLYDQAILAGGADGSPDYSLMTMVLYIYNACFRQFAFGYASAIGVILFIIIFSLTMFQKLIFGNDAWKAND